MRDGVIYFASDVMQRKEDETVEEMVIRFRTVGDMTCTGAVLSEADTLEKIIEEVAYFARYRTWHSLPMTNAPKQRWKIGRKRGIFNLGF